MNALPRALRGIARRPELGRVWALTGYWLGLSALWGALSTIVVPRLVEQTAAAAVKTSALSLVVGLQAVVSILVQPISGAASDQLATRWGRRRPLMVVGVVAELLFLVLLARAQAYGAVVVAMLLIELASNTAQGPYQALLPDTIAPRSRGLASGMVGAGQLAGQVIGVAVAGVLVANGDEAAAIAFAGVSVGLGTLATVLGVHEVGRGSADQHGPGGLGSLLGMLRPGSWLPPLRTVVFQAWGTDVLARRNYIWLLVSRLAILMATGTLQPFIYFYLEDSLGLGDRAGPLVAPIAALVAFIALFSAIPGGVLAERWGRVRTVVVSGVVGAVGAAAFAVAPTYESLFVIAIPFGVALGVFLSADWALLVEVVPPDEAGRYLGMSNVATAGAGLLAVVVAGPVADLVNGAGPGLGYRAVFGLAALEFAAGALFARRVPEPRQ